MRHNRGFTLVEVLIAGVILFTAIAIAYKGFIQSRHSSDQAQRVLKMNMILPVVVQTIKSQIKADDIKVRQGSGVLDGVTYNWIASQTQTRSLYQTGDFSEPQGNFVHLYQVDITLSFANSSRQFSYTEVSE